MARRTKTDEGSFTFFWRIENFTYCLQKTSEHLDSPTFTVQSLYGSKWFLRLYPKGNSSDNVTHITCYLMRQADRTKPDAITIDFEFSLLKSDHSYQSGMVHSQTFRKNERGSYVDRFLRDEVLKNRNLLLPLDTLTVRCRIWSSNVTTMDPGQLFAHTHVRVDRRVFNWNINYFSSLRSNRILSIPVKSTLKDFPSLILKLFLAGGSVCEERIQFEILRLRTEQKSLTTCKISLLDLEGETKEDMQDEHYFDATKGEQTWTFLPFIQKNRITSNQALYLKNNVLSLRCEFVVSIGSEKVPFSTASFKKNSTSKDNNEQCTVSDYTLNYDLKSLYETGAFSDFKILVDFETFPVHKNILCARSAVFSAMLNNDTKEKSSSSVDIIDLDSETVKRMLEYMYTDSIGDFLWQSASKLYIAADKYDIVGLKRKCSSLLTANISAQNALELLALANTLRDDDLKSAARGFIVDRSQSITESEEWNQFEKNNPQLAFEMWRHIARS